MFLSTLVTLVIVPVYYVLFDRFGAYVARLARREKTPPPLAPPIHTTEARVSAARLVPPG